MHRASFSQGCAAGSAGLEGCQGVINGQDRLAVSQASRNSSMKPLFIPLFSKVVMSNTVSEAGEVMAEGSNSTIKVNVSFAF